MKTFAVLALLTLVQLFSKSAQAYVLPLENILQKSAAVAGASVISVEQDVQFKDAEKTYTIKEVWLIEGDRNLRLTARGTGELRDSVILNYVYNNKTRTQLSGKNKVSHASGEDFFEKYLAIKSKDSYQAYMKDLGIADSVRLSRAGGTICYAIGAESSTGDLKPELWIDENSFRLMKMRLPSHAEAEFTDYVEKDGFHYPKQKTISWDGKVVTITVTRVSAARSASLKSFYPESLEFSSKLNFTALGPAGISLEEFYQRFR